MKCLLPNCESSTGGPHQPFCTFHWGMVLPPMQKTIVRLYRNGHASSGYAEAVANALQQVQDRVAAPRLDPFTSWPFRRA